MSDLSVAAAISTLTGAIGVLFWALIASLQARIQRERESGQEQVTRERELTNKLLPAVEENTRTLTRVVELMVSRQEEDRREWAEIKKTLERISKGGRSA